MASIPKDMSYYPKLYNQPIYTYGNSSTSSSAQTLKLEGINAIIPGKGHLEALEGFLVVEYGYYQDFDYQQGYISSKVAPMKAHIELISEPGTSTLFRVLAKNGEKDSLF